MLDACGQAGDDIRLDRALFHIPEIVGSYHLVEALLVNAGIFYGRHGSLGRYVRSHKIIGNIPALPYACYGPELLSDLFMGYIEGHTACIVKFILCKILVCHCNRRYKTPRTGY